eukprot:3718557-Rhodomonas_salina.1
MHRHASTCISACIDTHLSSSQRAPVPACLKIGSHLSSRSQKKSGVDSMSDSKFTYHKSNPRSNLKRAA